MSPEESIGEILAKAREEQGKTLVEIEAALKIRAKYLEALENNQFQLILESIFVKGFLKSYASYLKLDPKFLIEEYNNKYESLPQTPPKSPVPPQERGIPSRPIFLTAIFLSVLLFISGIFWLNLSVNFRKRGEKTEVLSSKEGKEPSKKVPSTEKETPPPQIQGVSLKVKVVAEEGCWLRVISDGVKVYEGILKKGETREWRAKNSLLLRAGNAGGIEIEKNGKLLPPLGKRGEVVEVTFTPNP